MNKLLNCSPRRIGSRAYFFFLLFQCFINGSWTELLFQPYNWPRCKSYCRWLKRSISRFQVGRHWWPRAIRALPITFVPNAHRPNRLGAYAGLQVRWLQLGVVCFLNATPRAERKLGQVCSEKEYANVFDRLKNTLPPSVEHLIIQLGDFLPVIRGPTDGNWIITGIPILYPRLGLLETVLSSRFFPAAALNKLGFKLNDFNGDAELLDDLVITFIFSRLHPSSVIFEEWPLDVEAKQGLYLAFL